MAQTAACREQSCSSEGGNVRRRGGGWNDASVSKLESWREDIRIYHILHRLFGWLAALSCTSHLTERAGNRSE